MILYARQKRDNDVKNRLLNSVRESEGGMIWENSFETYNTICKRGEQCKSMHEAEHSKLELWDYSEGWGGEGGGKWVQNGGHMHLCLIHINVWPKPSQYCKVIILQFKLLIN